MGLLGKLQFWKKHDNLGLDDPGFDPGSDMTGLNNNPGGSVDHLGLDNSTDRLIGQQGFDSNTGTIDQPASFEKKSSYEDSLSTPITSGQSGSKDLDLISSKLDTIKAALDAMNQRIMKIEKIAEQEESKHEEKKPIW